MLEWESECANLESGGGEDEKIGVRGQRELFVEQGVGFFALVALEQSQYLPALASFFEQVHDGVDLFPVQPHQLGHHAVELFQGGQDGFGRFGVDRGPGLDGRGLGGTVDLGFERGGERGHHPLQETGRS